MAKQHGLSQDEMERRYMPSLAGENAAKRQQKEQAEIDAYRLQNGLIPGEDEERFANNICNTEEIQETRPDNT